MKKLLSLLLAALLAAAVLPAWAQEDTRVFTDDAGRDVTLPRNIRRLVVSGPLAQIYAFAVAPDILAGLSSRWGESELPYIPEAYHSLPVVGQLYGGKGEVNLEELARLKPDVLIDIGQAKETIAGDLDSLQERTGVPCVHIAATLSTSGGAFRRLGALLNRAEEAEQLALLCDNAYQRAQALAEKAGERKVKAVYFAGIDGLSVWARTSFHAEALDMLCDNAAVLPEVSSKGVGNQVDMEQLLLWDPEVLIFAPGGTYEAAKSDPAWQGLSAVRENRMLEAPGAPYNWMGNPVSVQRYLSLIWLGKALYPDLADYDVQAEVQQFYRLFFHKELSDGAYRALTENAFFAAPL